MSWVRGAFPLFLAVTFGIGNGEYLQLRSYRKELTGIQGFGSLVQLSRSSRKKQSRPSVKLKSDSQAYTYMYIGKLSWSVKLEVM